MTTTEDQQKWDARYRGGAYSERDHPSELLSQWLPEKPGEACDLACGRGRNSRFMAQRGFVVDGYDVSPVGLELASGIAPELNINWLQRNLLADGIPADRRYDVIVMFRFVAMELLAKLHQHLRKGGLLIVENHLRWVDTTIELAGPGSDRFRVAPGAQAQALGEHMELLYEKEGRSIDPDGSDVALAQLVARKMRA